MALRRIPQLASSALSSIISTGGQEHGSGIRVGPGGEISNTGRHGGGSCICGVLPGCQKIQNRDISKP
jgi:hypothetical protein